MIEEVVARDAAEEKRARARALASRRVEELRRDGNVETLLERLLAPMDITDRELRRIMDKDLAGA